MRFLMCRPDYYGIEYEINPWMNVKHKADRLLAIAQWEELVETMQDCGAQIELIEGEQGWPDMVFTANAGLYYHSQIILPHFKFKQRQGELPYFIEWFKINGFSIPNEITPESHHFEGAGDALLAGDLLFVGYGFRSDKVFYEKASYLNQEKLVYCELVNPYYYHIDTCFCPLNDKIAIWYPHAFTIHTQEIMKNKIKLLEVIENEAKHFACNAVVIENHIIIPTGSPTLSQTLEDQGLTVHALNMSEFIKAGGACKCLTLRID